MKTIVVIAEDRLCVKCFFFCFCVLTRFAALCYIDVNLNSKKELIMRLKEALEKRAKWNGEWLKVAFWEGIDWKAEWGVKTGTKTTLDQMIERSETDDGEWDYAERWLRRWEGKEVVEYYNILGG